MLESQHKRSFVARWAVATIMAVLLGAPGWAAAQRPGGIAVFGTSLSDPGNAFILLGGAMSTPPDYSLDPFLVPDRPYARGGHHFSDGATWIEQFSRPLGLGAGARPAFAPGGGTNFAVGGARARAFGDSPHLGLQVQAFLGAAGGVAPPSWLYVIETGGNDMRDALLAFAGGAIPEGQAILADAQTAIGLNLQALYAAGARTFLVWNMPNVGLTPAIAPTPLAGIANQLALQFNAELEENVLTPLSALPGIRIARFDVYATLNGVAAAPSTFGLTNVTDACISISAPYACHNPNDYLFWDGIHPTMAAHGILAFAARSAFQQ
jgi:phospholipase/lecithinase/hemolysin